MKPMSKEEKNEEKKKLQTAKEIAEIVAANMEANMKDPDFLDKKERILQETANEVINEPKLREKDRENPENEET